MEEKVTTNSPDEENKVTPSIPNPEAETVTPTVSNQLKEAATTHIPNQLEKLRDNLSSKTPYMIVGSLVFFLIIAVLWQSIVISIHAGEGGVLYRRLFGGTVMDYVYPEGVHVIFPWDVMTIYNARIQLIKHEFDVLSNQGLPIHLNIAIRFRPQYDLLPVLHQQVGPDYVDKIIIPQIESVLRKNIGQYDPEDIYTNKQGVLSNIIVLALEETGRKFVQVDEIMIRSLELPPTIKKAIEEKLTYQQQASAYGYRLLREEQEAKRKRIEAKGIAEYQEIISQNLSGRLLTWQGIHATNELAASNNAKVVIIGAGEGGLPVILGGIEGSGNAANNQKPTAMGEVKQAEMAPKVETVGKTVEGKKNASPTPAPQ